MRNNKRRNPNPHNAVKGPLVETQRGQDASTKGNTQWTNDQMVQHGEEPLDGRFGLLSSTIYNEKNANKSYRKDVYVDAEDLHTLPVQVHKGLDELGGENVHVGMSLVNISAGLPAQEEGHLILNHQIKGLDRFHGEETLETVEAWTPRLTIVKNDPEAGGAETTTIKQVVSEAAEWPTADGTIRRERTQIGHDKHLQVHKFATDGEFGELTSVDSFGGNGCPVEIIEQRVPNDFVMPGVTLEVLAQKLEAIDGQTKKYSKVELINGWPTLISYEEEPSTGKRVKVTRTMHDALPETAANGTARFVSDVEHVSCGRWAKTIREIDSTILSTTYVEHHTMDFGIPAFLHASTPILKADSAGTSALYPLKSSEYTIKVVGRHEITYHASAPTPSSLFFFRTVDVDFRLGDHFIRVNNVLTDGATVSVRVYRDAYKNATYPIESIPENLLNIMTVLLSVTFGASTPTTSEFLGSIAGGPEILIAEDCSRWNFNLWRRVKVYIRVPALAAPTGGLA